MPMYREKCEWQNRARARTKNYHYVLACIFFLCLFFFSLSLVDWTVVYEAKKASKNRNNNDNKMKFHRVRMVFGHTSKTMNERTNKEMQIHVHNLSKAIFNGIE